MWVELHIMQLCKRGAINNWCHYNWDLWIPFQIPLLDSFFQEVFIIILEQS